MSKHIYRVITRNSEGELRVREYGNDEMQRRHEQIGINDYSIDMSIRGCPVFKGLIGPMLEADGELRYESPEIFEWRSKEWCEHKRKYRTRKRKSAFV